MSQRGLWRQHDLGVAQNRGGVSVVIFWGYPVGCHPGGLKDPGARFEFLRQFVTKTKFRPVCLIYFHLPNKHDLAVPNCGTEAAFRLIGS